MSKTVLVRTAAQHVEDGVIGLVGALHLVDLLSEAVIACGDDANHLGDHGFRDGVEFLVGGDLALVRGDLCEVAVLLGLGE
ncbi:hypothetical protein ACIBJI_23890 [Nocardia sp. NPDC050408]|uniref:hypothetical protein n=1 Tax=Nocardia sp. NPDC050408 TaxID=3364319 RepID=UPI003797A366